MKKERPEWSRPDSFRGNSLGKSLTKIRSCPVCGHAVHSPVLDYREFQFFSDSALQPKRANVRQVQCQSCYTLYMNPCYSAEGFATLFADASASYGATTAQVEWLRDAGILDEDSRVLDIGCHEGGFLKSMGKCGRRLGIDVDRIALDRGRQSIDSPDLELMSADPLEFVPPFSPTLITVMNVLEHMAEPVRFLAKLRSYSEPGTRLVLELPLLEYYPIQDITGFFSVQHMTHFSVTSLGNCLLRSGWRRSSAQVGNLVVAEPLSEDPQDIRACPSDLTETVRVLDTWQQLLNAVRERIRRRPPLPRYAIWGAGLHTEMLYHLTDLFLDGRTLFILVDRDRAKQGTTWRGVPIYDPSILNSTDLADAGVLISSHAHQASIRSGVGTLVPDSRVVTIY